MKTKAEMFPIVMVDDDPDDRLLTEKALRANRVANPILFLEDGEELMAYLRKQGKYQAEDKQVRPCFILLDLNMPRMDGRKALSIIKSDPEFRKIPVIILTTSQAEEDVLRSYNLGANSFVTKPIDFEQLVNVMETVKQYWLEIVELPPAESALP